MNDTIKTSIVQNHLKPATNYQPEEYSPLSKKDFRFEQQIGREVIISCDISTYRTKGYHTIDNVLDTNRTREENLREGRLSRFNKVGRKAGTMNISSPNFNLEGTMNGIAVISSETGEFLDLFCIKDDDADKTYDQDCPFVIMGSWENHVILARGEMYIDYDMTSHSIAGTFRNGTISLQENYILFLSDEYYDVYNAISIYDLSSRKEYNVSTIIAEDYGKVLKIKEEDTLIDLGKKVLVIANDNGLDITYPLEDIFERCSQI